ncbi:MAG: hypothetical protein GWO79_00130 [Actinobacteria bacterium]|nr:hypothetical protein [Actinomycetota bacterium]
MSKPINFHINCYLQKRSSAGGNPFGPPNTLSDIDHLHSTDQKTVFMQVDFCHTSR